MYVKDEEELGKAIKNNEETIEMKENLDRRICRIWNMDKRLWCLCMACPNVAVAPLIVSPSIGGILAVAGFVSGTPQFTEPSNTDSIGTVAQRGIIDKQKER